MNPSRPWEHYFSFLYKNIDKALDEGFTYETLVWTFNPEHFADPHLIPQSWIRKEALVLQMFSPKMHVLVIGPPGIGKTTITDFFYKIHFPFDRATLVATQYGSVTTTAGLRETVIRLSRNIMNEFELDINPSFDPKRIPKAILHLEEFLKAPPSFRDIMKAVMNDNILIIRQAERREEYPAPINVYADTNPPGQDTWIGNDFRSKKAQLEEFAKETAFVRRFTVVLALDDYTIGQKALIRKYIAYYRTNPHPAIESGEFFEKYEEFVRKRRRLKVKVKDVPDRVFNFILGLERDLVSTGKLLLPIIHTDFIQNIISIAEGFARIKGHKEVMDDDWKDAMDFVTRCIETIADIPPTKKIKFYEHILSVGRRMKRELEEKFRVREGVYK